MLPLLTKIAETVSSKHRIGNITSSTISVDGIKYTKTRFYEEFLSGPQLKEMGALELLGLSETEKKKSFSDIIHIINTKKFQDAENSVSSGDIPESSIDRTKYLPIVDVKSDQVLLVNVQSKSISDLNVKTWERGLNPEQRFVAYSQLRDALLVYDPYDLSTFVMTEFETGTEVLKVNTYMPPQWRHKEIPSGNVACPPEIYKILTHLFESKACLDFVINWLYNCLVNRNETYLVLNGAKGVGKGVFSSLVCMLVGRNNYTEAPVSLLSDKFNSSLDKKRVIVFDEFTVGKSEHTKLKRYINRYQNIEKKGIDANNATEIYNSYIISNNDESDMYLECDDRRFSVVDITTKPLTDIMAIADIKELDERLENDEDLAYQFGYWIYLQGQSDTLDNFSVYKGAKFSRLVYQSLSEWQKFIVDEISERKENYLPIKNLARDFSRKSQKQGRFPYSSKKIGDFLTNFRDEKGEKLGRLGDIEGERVILPTENYLPITDSEDLL